MSLITPTSTLSPSFISPAAVLEEETSLHPPTSSTSSFPSKLPQYRLFHCSTTPPPGTLRTHRHAALPSSKRSFPIVVDFCSDGCGASSSSSPSTPALAPLSSPQACDLSLLIAALNRGGDDAVAALRQLVAACADAPAPPPDEPNPLLTLILQHDVQHKDRLLPLLLSRLTSFPLPLHPHQQQQVYFIAGLFAYLTTGTSSQCQFLIEIGLLPHLIRLLSQHRAVHAFISEAVLTALGNVCAHPTCRAVALLSGSVDLLASILRLERAPTHRFSPHCSCIDCRSTPSRRLAMWTLSLLARSCALPTSSSSSASALLAPLVPQLCRGFELETDPDVSTHLVFFFYSLTSSSASTYHFPMPSTQQAMHWQLCSLVPVSLYPTLLGLLGHEEVNVIYGALSILSNLVFSSADILSTLLTCGLLPALTALYGSVRQQSLSEGNVLIHTQINFILSCIAASPSHGHMMALMTTSPFVDAMIADVNSSVLEISKEATWCIGNLTRGYWKVQRKDREGRYPLAVGLTGGDEEKETKERRAILARKEGLIRSLCSLLSLEYEEDEEHCTLMQISLVAVTNLLSEEWWVYSLLNTKGPAGLRRADEVRRSSTKALEIAQTLSQSLLALQSQGLVAANYAKMGEPTTDMTNDAMEADEPDKALPLPPFPCFNPSYVLSHHPNALSYCAFPTASPLHTPEAHPASAAFLACRGLGLLARLEQSSLVHVSKFAEWVLCLMFTEFCRKHDEHRQTPHTHHHTPAASACQHRTQRHSPVCICRLSLPLLSALCV